MAYAAYLAIGALLLAALSTIQTQAADTADYSRATVAAAQCAGLLNALYAHHLFQSDFVLPNCFPAGEHRIGAQTGRFSSYQFLFSPTAHLIILPTGARLEIEPADHYGRTR